MTTLKALFDRLRGKETPVISRLEPLEHRLMVWIVTGQWTDQERVL